MIKAREKGQISKMPKKRWLFMIGLAVGLIVVASIWWVTQAGAAAPKEAPEAEKILDIQANMPFQVLIPAYLPQGFEREKIEIMTDQKGPSGEAMIQLTYRTTDGRPLFLREWVPINPQKEILANSRPVETKWGKGWLLHATGGLIALWMDIGPLRVSVYTTDDKLVDQEHLLAISNNLGPASNRQVFSFVVDPPSVKEIQPPPPVQIETNANGVQEVDLIVTPGGYSPLRFAVKKGLKVRLTFRQLGNVGCGNELNFPVSPSEMKALTLKSPTDKQVLEFTPENAGQFEFYCGHLMYRGVIYVQE